jgi:hypothetical protein
VCWKEEGREVEREEWKVGKGMEDESEKMHITISDRRPLRSVERLSTREDVQMSRRIENRDLIHLKRECPVKRNEPIHLLIFHWSIQILRRQTPPYAPQIDLHLQD